MLNEDKTSTNQGLFKVIDFFSSGKFLVFLFLAIAGQRYMFDKELFAQFIQQGPKIVGTGATGNDTQGFSVAISSDGNTAIEGGWHDNNAVGAVWVFTRSGGIWTQQGQKIVGTGGTQYFPDQGYSVAISSDGNTAIAGGPGDNWGTGAVWIFVRTGSVWTQQGPKLIGTGAVYNAFQGISVAISSDGNTALVGGYQDNTNTGAAWIFIRSGGVWTQQGPKLIGSGAMGNARQGWSVGISSDGNTSIIGGDWDNNNVGAIWYSPETTEFGLSKDLSWWVPEVSETQFKAIQLQFHQTEIQ